MSELIFSIPGVPAAKGRPRMTRAGHVYTPAKTATAENLVSIYADQAMEGAELMVGPVAISILAKFVVPPSYSAKRRALCISGQLLPEKKPDLDNIIKLITDAMNGIVYQDDKQVVGIRALKVYAAHPETEVTVEIVDSTEHLEKGTIN